MSTQPMHVWRATGISVGVALLLSLLGWVSLGQHALAATDQQPLDVQASITVNTDSPTITDDGLCSIIEAIENANFDALIHDDCVEGSGADTIALPNDAVILFTTTHNAVGGGNALPVITSTVSIVGNGTTLVRDSNNAPAFRFFNVEVDGDLTLSELGMSHGRAGLGGTLQLLFGGGAIVNQGTLRIFNSSLSFNSASFGGAIYSQPMTGSLSLNNTTFSSNHADFSGGAVYNFGPGSITSGVMRFNTAGSDGGAILHDSSTLTVKNVTVLDNIAVGSGAGIAGRALVTDSLLSIESTSVISNAAGLNGGGIYNSASNGLTSQVHITGSAITANRATSTGTLEGVGGGLINGWTGAEGSGVAQMQVRNTSIVNNVAQMGGGAANVDGSGFATRTAELVILQSTLARNTAAGLGSGRGTGGALYNSNARASVANSTLSSNQAVGDDEASGGRGGGIGNIGRGVTTTVDLLNSTIAFNEATQAGGGIAVMGALSSTTPTTGTASSTTTLSVGNSLIVSNALSVTQSISNAFVLAEVAALQVITGTESCSIENGSTHSLGGNIEDGTTCELNTVTDLQNTVVALGVLADNGGPTQTHSITEAGAAFDGGVDALCAAEPVSGVDQRGVARPQGEHCDVGAVELEAEPPVDEDVVMWFPQMYRFHSFQ